MATTNLTRSSVVGRLVMANRISELRGMSEWLTEGVRSLGLPETVVFNFDLCANEAVGNIILYGYSEPAEHQIVLRLLYDAAEIALEVTDDGKPFDPLSYPRRVPPTSLEEARVGGFGIELIRSLMSECHYEQAGGRNVFRMIHRIKPPAGAP